MEWRFFFPMEKEDFQNPKLDLFQSLGINKGSQEHERTDDYYALEDTNLGLKLRNASSSNPLLELKIGSKEQHGIEHWVKVMIVSCRSHENVVDILSKQNHNKARECLKHLKTYEQNNQKPVICQITKKRWQVSHKHCTIEQTDLDVSIRGSSSVSQYRSICVESGPVTDYVIEYMEPFLKQVINQKGYTEKDEQSAIFKPAGYPKFVWWIRTEQLL